MDVLVTGAGGWIGSAVVADLLEHGYGVAGIARSDEAAERVAALGADVVRGDLGDPDGLGAAAAAADGVVHLAYHHDFTQMEEAARIDAAVIEALGAGLAGSDRPLLVASGVAGLAPGRVANEVDEPDPAVHPRVANAAAALALAERGVRSVVVRFPPTVHGPGDRGFVAMLVDIARRHGTAGYVGDGANRWPAVHRLDAAVAVRRALEAAPAGSVVHAVAETGVATRDIATAIGRGLDVPTDSVAPDAAWDHFGWLGMFFGADIPASSDATRAALGWEPTHPGLLADLDSGCYTGG